MTTGTTPNYGFIYPFGDEPVSNVDDILEQSFTMIDQVLHDSAVGRTVAFKLSWTGSYSMAALIDYQPVYTQNLDQTKGTGFVPEYNYSLGITVPSTGLWHVEVFSRYVNANTAGVSVAVDSTLLVDNLITRSTVVTVSDPNTTAIQLPTEWTGWLEAGMKVRSRGRSSRTLVTTTEQAVRLVGPLNSGANL